MTAGLYYWYLVAYHFEILTEAYQSQRHGFFFLSVHTYLFVLSSYLISHLLSTLNKPTNHPLPQIQAHMQAKKLPCYHHRVISKQRTASPSLQTTSIQITALLTLLTHKHVIMCKNTTLFPV